MAITGKTNTRGFTLIEILAVLTIMMIMMGMGMFAFVEWGRGSALRSATSNVMAGISRARTHTITYREPTWLVCSNAMTPLLRGYFYVENAADGLMGVTNFLPEGLAFTEGTDSPLTFNLDGSVDLEGLETYRYVEIYEPFRPGGGTTNRIRVYGLTGRTVVLDD